MSESVGIFGDLPTGRRLDQDSPHPPGYLGAVGILKPYSPELGELLRRRIREIDDADLVQDGKTWTDTTDGIQYEIVMEFVNPISPEDSLVEAFVVRDDLVVYLRPRGATHEAKSVSVGVMSGRRVS